MILGAYLRNLGIAEAPPKHLFRDRVARLPGQYRLAAGLMLYVLQREGGVVACAEPVYAAARALLPIPGLAKLPHCIQGDGILRPLRAGGTCTAACVTETSPKTIGHTLLLYV